MGAKIKITMLITSFFMAFPAFASDSFTGEHESYINLNWFENFHDPYLMEYINIALNFNHDVKIANNNILKARQEINLKISKEFPYVGVGSNYLLLKVPKLAIPDNDIQTNSYALPFMTVWEVDYLGKNYNKIQKSRLDFKNSILELKSTNLIVSTDVASNYFNISNLDNEINLQNQKLEFYKKIFSLKKIMQKEGIISLYEVNICEDKIIKEANKLNDLLKKRENFLLSLSYLLGKSAKVADTIKVAPFDEIYYMGEYPNSIPSETALKRPDMMIAENNLKKAKIDVTIAKKEFLPMLNVFGILTFSTILQKFDWQTALAALSVGGMQTIFDGGHNIFVHKKRKIEYESALEKYFKTDLTALLEINNALYALKTDYVTYKNMKERKKLSDKNLKIKYISYVEGSETYIDYLEEKISNLEKEIDLCNLKNRNLSNLLTIYKTTGGML